MATSKIVKANEKIAEKVVGGYQKIENAFVALVLGTVSGVFFALGMCMALLPEWGMRTQGVVCGVIGIVVRLMLIPLTKGLK